MGRIKEELEGKAKTYSIQYTENSLVDIILLNDMKENWILQSPALSKSSGMDSSTGKSTHAK